MAVKIYQGEVVFPTSNPFPSNYDEGKFVVNIVVRMDDPTAPGCDSPKTDPGEVRIYKNTDTADGAYMQTLKRGDRVMMIWNEMGSKSHYSFIMPDGPDTPLPEPPKAQYQVQAPVTSHATSPVNAMQPQPDGNMAAFQYGLDYVADMYRLAVAKANEFDVDDKHALAQRFVGWTASWLWRPGQVLAVDREVEVITSEDDKDAFLSMIDEKDPVVSWLDAAEVWIDDAGKENIISIITKLGIHSGEWIGTKDGRWNLLMAVETYWLLSQQGFDHNDIVKAVNKYGVKAPASLPF